MQWALNVSGVARVRLLGKQPDQWRPPVVLVFFARSWFAGSESLEAPKNLHLTVLKTGSKIVQKHVEGYAFFHVHCSTKSQENSKRSKILNSQVSYQNKMCMFYISSWIIFHKFKKQAKSHRSVPRSAVYVKTSEQFF